MNDCQSCHRIFTHSFKGNMCSDCLQIATQQKHHTRQHTQMKSMMFFLRCALMKQENLCCIVVFQHQIFAKISLEFMDSMSIQAICSLDLHNVYDKGGTLNCCTNIF